MSTRQDLHIWFNRPYEESLKLESLTREILTFYRYELRERVSMPALYRADQEMWWNIVKEVDPNYAYREDNIKSLYYSQKFKEYHNTTPLMQRRLDAFVLYMEEDSADSLVTVLGLRTTDDYCQAFGVDRTTALKIKSLYRKQVYLEPEWVKAG